MTSEELVAVIAFCGTVIGSVGGVLASSKLTNFRLKKLEEKVDKHNGLVERMYEVEKDVEHICDTLQEIKRRAENGR